MCAGNNASQDYFGRRSSFVLARPSVADGAADGADGGGEPPGATRVFKQLWMDTVLEQLEAPLGPAVTLSKLLSANEELLAKYATPKLVLRFSDMVQLLGPQRRLVDFFAAICIVQGRAVKPNQEMVLRLTWMKPEVRKATYLQLRPLVRPSSAAAAGTNKYGPVALPSGASTDGTIDLAAARPPHFLGHAAYTRVGGFSPVGVTWSGAAAWGRGQPTALFWDLQGLGLEATAMKVDGGMGDDGEEVSVKGAHARVNIKRQQG